VFKFKYERNNTLLIFTTDESGLCEDVANEVEQEFHALDRSKVHDVIINLTGVRFIASHFANWIMLVHLETQRKGGQLIVCSVCEHIIELLARLHFTSTVVIVCDELTARLLLLLSDNEKTASTV